MRKEKIRKILRKREEKTLEIETTRSKGMELIKDDSFAL
jgi:hypothetical protein